MKLILVRHAETVENSKGIVQGHLPGTLSERGILQAKKVAERLNNEHIDIVYSSDLKRAVDTTAEIIKFKPEIQVIYDEILREIDMGVNQGKTMEELNWVHDFKGIYNPPEKGESTEQLYERTLKFLKQILAKHLDETVLVVTHGGNIKAFIAIFTKMHKSRVFEVEKQNNTGVSIIETNEKLEYNFLILNDVEHLK